MRVGVDSRELRRYVVRVASQAGQILGTGFFVAPGWALTCAHVVGDARELVITPAAAGPAGDGVPAVVKARSDRPAQSGGLWPFPDLALLQLKGQIDHPCVLLDTREPAGELDCHAWGFARREEGVAPIGSPASFRYEGVEGDGYLRLKQGQAAPGLSGAPLICPVRRAVVGVVSATRDVRTDLGGWASPISALLFGGPGVPHELVELGAGLRQPNHAAVVAQRDLWNRVLPVEEAENLLKQPWERFTRQPRSTPSSLLLAEHAVVPYRFRDEQLRAAVAWCDDATRMSMLSVPGRGGAGKTRFAIELCKRMSTRGWLAGLWRPDRSADRVPVPRLIVIDYAEAANPQALDDMLDDLRRGASEISPVRVLLLTRTRTSRASDPLDALRELATATLQSVMDATESSDAAESSLSGAQRQSLYREAVAGFIAAWRDDAADKVAWPTGDDEPDLEDDRFGVPLEVLFLAHDRAIGPQPANAALPPADRVLAHEERYWQRTAPADVGHELLRRCVALSTLAGAASNEEAHALLATLSALASQPQTRETIIGWLSDLYDGPGVLNPLRPDRLGEALIAKLLRGEDDHGRALLDAVAGLPSDDQLVRALDVLTRLSATDELTAAAMAQMLARHHIRLVLRAEAQARGTRNRPGRLDLANAIARPLAGQLASTVAEALAAAEPWNTTYQRDVSVSYNKLGDLARESGQAPEAVKLLGAAVKTRRALCVQEPRRVDLAEEFAVALYLFTQAESGAIKDCQLEIIALLAPFEQAGALTPKGTGVLAWARQ